VDAVNIRRIFFTTVVTLAQTNRSSIGGSVSDVTGAVPSSAQRDSQ